MKLLFDQNLSPLLVRLLTAEYPGSLHVRDVGLAAAPDPTVWTYATAQGLAIVSKGSDFQHRALLLGHPPSGCVWGTVRRPWLAPCCVPDRPQIRSLDRTFPGPDNPLIVARGDQRMTPAHRIETILAEDGKLSLDHLPYLAGQAVEVFVLPVPCPVPVDQSLHGTLVRYDRPTEPVAVDDWSVLR